MSDLYVKMVVMIFGPRFQIDSYWMQVVTQELRSPEDSARIFPHGISTQSVEVVARFAWQFLSAAN